MKIYQFELGFTFKEIQESDKKVGFLIRTLRNRVLSQGFFSNL